MRFHSPARASDSGGQAGPLRWPPAMSAATAGLGVLLWEPLLWGLPVQVLGLEEQ